MQTTPTYQRARSAEHKADRFAQIMAAADRLFLCDGFHAVTLTSIAKEMGMARGNLYKYAPTKEEIFLALYQEKIQAYLDTLIAELDALEPCGERPGRDELSQMANAWASAADRHHDYLRYQHILTSVIETNVTLEALVTFKQKLKCMLETFTDVFCRLLPAANSNDASEAFLAVAYHASCLEGHICVTELQAEAMRQAGLPLPAGGFTGELQRFILVYLMGLCSTKEAAR